MSLRTGSIYHTSLGTCPIWLALSRILFLPLFQNVKAESSPPPATIHPCSKSTWQRVATLGKQQIPAMPPSKPIYEIFLPSVVPISPEINAILRMLEVGWRQRMTLRDDRYYWKNGRLLLLRCGI